jgi:hypothetical protein
VTTLQTADGRLLRAQRPQGAAFNGAFMPNQFPPMWSSGERAGDDACLKSYEAIYRSQPNLAAVVDKLTRRVATLPFDAYRHLPNQAREMVPHTDALASLLAKPMPRSSRCICWRTSCSRC